MAMRDLDELIDDTLKLPVSGVTYLVPGPDALTALWCLRLSENTLRAGVEGASVVLDDDDERTMYQRTLGPVYDQMMAAGVSLAKIAFCGQTAFIWITNGIVAAEAYWETGGKAPTPNRAARRSTSTDGASATRTRVSTNGTKSRATKSTVSPAPRTRSHGPKS
jgi:hypothetical protein